MDTDIPRRYHRLLITYPRRWRREHETVVLGTLLEADEAAGRSRPHRRHRVGFLVGGMLIRLPHRVRPSRAAHLLIADAGWHAFDQSNGFDQQREPTEGELEHWNAAHEPSLGDSRVATLSSVGMGIGG
jgi:hypothetical protein